MYLEGGRGHGWTEGVVGHGDGHGVGAGLPVWRSGHQRDEVLIQLDGALVQVFGEALPRHPEDDVLVRLELVCAVWKGWPTNVWFWGDNLGLPSWRLTLWGSS